MLSEPNCHNEAQSSTTRYDQARQSTSQGRPPLVPVGCLLIGVACPQDGLLSQGGPDNLKAHREPVCEARRNAQAADPGDVDRDGEDIAQIHLNGVSSLFA